MGYQTEYKGEFKFTSELKATELAHLSSFLNEDCRDHPEWNAEIDNYYVSLSLSDNFSGIEWSGMEKTYNMPQIINFIIVEMSKVKPNFGLKGKMAAQGEDIDDIYEIVIENGEAVQHDLKPTGRKIQCPHCDEYFYID